MNQETVFRAFVVREQDGCFQRAVEERRVADLPPGEVLIRVQFSSLNYKDALSASGNRGVTKNYPHTPGIDAAGTVAVSSVSEFKEGDEVICMGYDLGMNTPGGFGQYIRVPQVSRRPSAQTRCLPGICGLSRGRCLSPEPQAESVP
jgi:alcohol dehydrogenase